MSNIVQFGLYACGIATGIGCANFGTPWGVGLAMVGFFGSYIVVRQR